MIADKKWEKDYDWGPGTRDWAMRYLCVMLVPSPGSLVPLFGGIYMKRFFFVAVVLITAVLAISCSSTKAVKKVTQDSKMATESFAVINAIKEAYVKKDVLATENNTTKDGLKAISGVVKSFDSAELDFNPVLVEIEDSTVSVNVSWKGTWNKGGKTTQEQGMAVFVLKGTPLKVDAILRANPFKYPE